MATAEDDDAEVEIIATADEAFLEFLACEMDNGGVPEGDAASTTTIVGSRDGNGYPVPVPYG